MPSPKSGTAGSPVAPAEAKKAEDADKADPGEVEKIKAEQRQAKAGKYGSVKVPAHKPPEDKKTKTKKTGWIEIELLDENGKPVAGQGYRITLPDGAVATGTLDPDGFARVEGFEPGNCKVTFPDLDERDWKTA